MKNKLTIIITTQNKRRQFHTSLNYYINKRFNGNIIVVDSSTGRCQSSIKRLCKKAGEAGLTIKFISTGGIKYQAETIQMVSSSIDTPYTLGCNENDILLVTGLSRCMEFLEMNPDYVAASGTKCIKTTYPDKVGMHYIPCIEIETKYAKERLMTYFRAHRSITHYVHRTEVWQEMFSYANEVKNPWVANEILPGAISAIKGKIKDVLKDSLYQAVFCHSEPEPNSQGLSQLLSLEYIKSIRNALAIISKYLINGGLKYTDARKIIEKEFQLYLAMSLLFTIAEEHPEMKKSLDIYSKALEDYPFLRNRMGCTTTLTKEPHINFKTELNKFGVI